jgi:hypothetical protein
MDTFSKNVNYKLIIRNLKKEIMKTFGIVLFGALTMTLYSCKDDADKIDDPTGNESVELTYNFQDDTEGWNAAIAQFPADDEDLYEFETEQTTSPFDDEDGVLLLSATNPHDNLFMYASKQITGLEPNTRYRVSYNIEVASSVIIDTTGVDSDTTGVVTDTTAVDTDTTDVFTNLNDTVVIKAGAVSEEPETETTVDNLMQLSGIDIGEPGVDGADLIVLGSFAADTTAAGFETQAMATESPISVITNEDGDFWLLIGTETFGSRAEVYFTKIEVEIER